MLASVDRAVRTEVFRSILWPSDAPPGAATAPEVLHDLALDQVLDRLAEVAPAAADAFRTPCSDAEQVGYRQEVFRALEQPELRAQIDGFLASMGDADRCDALSAKAHYPYEAELWHLQAVARYTRGVRALSAALGERDDASDARGIRLLADCLAARCASDDFAATATRAREVAEDIAGLRFNVLMRSGRVTVAPIDDEPDLRADVRETFARFRDGDEQAAASGTSDLGLEHVQAWILERVAKVHPASFERLRAFFAATPDYRDETIVRLAAEVRFYLAYLDHLAPLRRAGLPICYPDVSPDEKTLEVRDTYDLALATRLVADGAAMVLNDLELNGPERVLVISGPNQGGKSTTARTFGQLHHLAAIGCPVAGGSARIHLCDQVLTAFEREERLDDLEGRLGAEIERMHGLLERATGDSALVLNEVFSSTALDDARTLTRDVLERILAVDALAVCVTFIDELSRLDERTVSMVSTVDPDDAARRTFRVERRTADGRAYARALAAVHGLTAEQIERRMGEERVR